MRIILLCVGGITSSILAKRLHNYSLENQKGDIFEAERYGSISLESLHGDLFMIAPQISKIVSETPSFEKIPSEKLFYISEKDYSTINVQGLYDQIDQLRNVLLADTATKKKWEMDSSLIHKGLCFCLLSVICYALIRFAEIGLRLNFGFARIFLPIIVLMCYADKLSESKQDGRVLHLANILFFFMMITPFGINPGFLEDEGLSSYVFIPHLNVYRFALSSFLTVVLYTLYNLWEDWFIEKNRFMMRFIRDTLCSGLFYMFVILLRFAIAFFVK
ncbi:MAG: hypothetical protein IJM15_07920 [Erysipelotrichaceae bacterium]|nr:hypothetical protein [Erysipelotrichaceae bacterium]